MIKNIFISLFFTFCFQNFTYSQDKEIYENSFVELVSILKNAKPNSKRVVFCLKTHILIINLTTKYLNMK